jgi:gliding-associated putative ABC transporter substrate-binding component GldG
MRGGKLMLFMDKLNAELDSLGLGAGRVVAYDRDLQLNDLLFKYGARVNPDLVMDLQCDVLPFDVNGNGQFELLPWNYFLVMEPGSQSSITKNLGYVSGKFVNSIDTVGEDYIKKTVLLHSSPNARTIATPAIISGAENEIAAQSERYNKANIPTAVLLEGKFESLYARRMMQWMRDSLAKYQVPYTQAAVEDGKIIIVADGDVVLNGVVKGGQPISMGMNSYTYGTQREFPFANKDFLLNCLSYMLDNNGLSESRNKEIVPRLLDNKLVQAEENNWKLINIALPVILIIIFAYIYNFLRRRKYK